MKAQVLDIRDGSEVCTGYRVEDMEENRKALLGGIELLRQHVEHNHVRALVWAWVDRDGLDLHHRVSNVHGAGNLELRGLAAGMTDYVNRVIRGEAQ